MRRVTQRQGQSQVKPAPVGRQYEKVAGNQVGLINNLHHATEVWRGNQVVALDTRTDDNGKAFQLKGVRGPAGLVLTGNHIERSIAPANALPATHWNKRELDGPWINTQDGKIIRPKVARAGSELIPRANGKSALAQRYNLTGEVALTMYYDDGGWAGLSFVKGGSLVRYEREA